MFKDLIIKHIIIAFLFYCVPIARNIIMSGYPFFPSVAFDFFDLDWKFPKEFAKSLSHYVVNHQLFDFLDLVKERKPYLSFFDGERLKDLFKMLMAQNIMEKGWFSPAILALLFSPFLVLTKRLKIGKLWSISVLILASNFILTSILMGLVYRYTAGNVLIFTVFVMAQILYQIGLMIGEIASKALKGALILIFSVLFLKNLLVASTPVSLKRETLNYPFKLIEEISKNLFILSTVPSSTFKAIKIDKININVSLYKPILAARNSIWFSYANPNCEINPIISYKTYSSCEEYNTLVATMNWMNDLPCVGAIYTFTKTRTGQIEDGFRANR